MGDNACAHSETSLDVDLIILDYLLVFSINSVLRDRDVQRRDGVYSEDTQRLLTTLSGESCETKYI
jgi:hypothetical protein